MKRLALLGLLFLLPGCVDISTVAKIEEDVLKASPPTTTYVGALSYGRGLTEGYLGLSTRGNRIDDGVFAILIGLAATTAFQTVKGADATELSKLGIAAISINEGSKYIANSEAVSNVLDAAEQTSCIVKEGTSRQGLLANAGTYSTQGAAILMNGLQTARINLRKKLLRETPDYEALATSLASAIVKDEATKDASFSGFESSGASTAELEKGISELSKLVSGCVLKTNNGT